MCPDRQLLSVYLDNELPSPWREKLEAHLESCVECQSSLNRYRSWSDASNSAVLFAESVEAAKARVWRKLSALNATELALPLWRRPLTLPLPLAAAAIAALIIASGFLFRSPPAANDQTVAEIGYDQGKAIPVSNMEDVLRYLETQDSQAEIVIIRLPESQYFNLSGQPSLVRAADYTGRPTP